MQIEIDGKAVFVATGGREHISGAPGFVFIHGAACRSSSTATVGLEMRE